MGQADERLGSEEVGSHLPVVLRIHLGQEKGAGKSAVGEAELVAAYGLRGDRHAGRDARRQVSLFAEEVRRELMREGLPLPAERLSANFFTDHLPLDQLGPGTILRIGQVELEITEARQPCRSITRIDHRLPKRLIGRCGQLARVVRGGTVRPGDVIEVIPPDPTAVLPTPAEEMTSRQPSLFD
jgi:MOSC domain-containing protein YiiM